LPDKPFTLIGLLVCSILSILPLLSGFPRLRRLELWFVRSAERRAFAVSFLFVAVIGIRLALLPLLHVPVPGVNDEFSYLLTADTFAHARLTNPPHPMWVSFETMHVNWNPTYMSIYPPAQGFVLAIGQVLGTPWIGVLLSNAAMCALIVWMLQSWIPPRWAFLGGVIVSLQLSFASYWMNSYWGGAVAAVGGALVLGALGRIRRRARVRDALLMGLGIAILANSRPLEGAALCLATVVYLLWWLAGKTKANTDLRARLRKVVFPLLGSLALLGIFLAYYNWRLTGHSLLLPHVLNTNTYVTTPMFLWERPKPPLTYRNAQMEYYYNAWARQYYSGTWADIRRVSAEKLSLFGEVFLWRAELLLVPFLYLVFRDRRTRFLLVTFFVSACGIFLVTWSNAHYAAPLLCVLTALVVQAMRHLNTIKLAGRRVGAMAVRMIVVILLVQTAGLALQGHCDGGEWRCAGLQQRAEIIRNLSSKPGKHLVMVQYGRLHYIHNEWVYNGADIDGAKVLWARDLDAAQNKKLFGYFKDRQIWLVKPEDIDRKARKLQPYPLAAAQSSP